MGYFSSSLEGAGLTLMDMYEGLALQLDPGESAGTGADTVADKTPTTVEIVPVQSEDEMRELLSVSGRVWGYSPEDQERMVKDRMEYLSLPSCRGGSLLARVNGQAAGNASYRYSSDGRTVYLNGACTLPDFQGRGVFRALVRWRLAAARARGCRFAAVLARVGTSAPILVKLGFTKYFDMPVYLYRP